MVTVRWELLKRLCETPGIAGYEGRVRDVVLPELRELADEVTVDALGNVMAFKRGAGDEPRRRVMLAAHMDEIGFMVSHIDAEGFLRLQPVGGFDPRALFQQRVLVHARSGADLRGVLAPAAKPAHLLDAADRDKATKLSELFVDVGLNGDAARAAIDIGDMVTLDRTVEEIGDCMIGKAFDDRLSLFIMLEALRTMAGARCDLFAVATVQEEVGLRGAETAAYAIQPDLSIALDVTLAVDLPGSEPRDHITTLGGGVALKLMDSSHISNPKLVRAFRDLAEHEAIPYQLEILPRGGTDAASMQRARGGSAAITLSTPTRYVHTVNEMAHKRDIEGAIALLARFLEVAHDVEYAL